MFSVFLGTVATKEPIIIVPGSFMANLYITTKLKRYWYCPTVNNKHVWGSLKYLVPPIVNCFFDWSKVAYDNQTGSIGNRDGVSINIGPFGDLDNIRGPFKALGKYIPPIYETYIKKFIENGYQANKDLFGAPYDWRFGIQQPSEFWNDLKNLVEESVHANDNKPAILIGHSLGTKLIHRFLNEKVSAEWRHQYISKILLVAPSWSGAGAFMAMYWQRHIPYLSFFKTEALKEWLGTLTLTTGHFPNEEVYANTTVIISPDGEEIKGKDLFNLEMQLKIFSDEEYLINKENIQYSKVVPPQLKDVDTYIMFNSGLPTPLGLSFKGKSWDSDGETIKGNGDGIALSDGTTMYCERGREYGVTCYDPKSGDSSKYNHGTILSTDDVVDIAMGWILKDYKP